MLPSKHLNAASKGCIAVKSFREGRMKKRIAVVAGYEWIFVSPSTISAVEMLAEHGYEVDLLARQQSNRFPGTGILHPDVMTPLPTAC